MSQFQQYILPITATAGLLYLTKKYFQYSQDYHSVIDTYTPSKPITSLTISKDYFPNYIKTKSGLVLHLRRYLVPSTHVKGLVFFLHGFTEHSGRYEGYAYELNKLGYSVCLIDHQGHGNSQGDRGFLTSFDNAIDDIIEWMNYEYNNMINSQAGWAVPGFGLTKEQIDLIVKNIVISAHSMGGLIATKLGLRLSTFINNSNSNETTTDKVDTNNNNSNPLPWLDLSKYPPRFVLSAPALALDKKLTDVPLLLKISSLLSTYLPKLQVQSMPSVELSLDPNISLLASRDPLIAPLSGIVLARVGSEFISNIQYCHTNASKFTFPILIMSSDGDDIVDSQGGKDFIGKVSTNENSKKHMNVNGKHEILFDNERKIMLEEINNFLQQHYKQ